MPELKEVITSYNSLSFSDRVVFYTTISNDISLSDVSIRNMYIGSLFNDKKLCFLVSFNNGEESLLHYVVCNENDKYKNYFFRSRDVQ